MCTVNEKPWHIQRLQKWAASLCPVEINPNAVVGSQLWWLFLRSRVICCGEALPAVSVSSRGGVALFLPNQTLELVTSFTLRGHTVSVQRRRYIFVLLTPRCQELQESSEPFGTVRGINLYNYINHFSQGALWKVCHCHQWRVQICELLRLEAFRTCHTFPSDCCQRLNWRAVSY